MPRAIQILFLFLVAVSQCEPQTLTRGTLAGTNEYAGPAVRATPVPVWEINPGYRDSGGIVLHGDVVVTGNINDAGGTYGFNAVTGARLWRIPGHMRGEPATDRTAVYAVNETPNSQYRLSKIEPKTGKLLWSVQDDDLGTHDVPPLVADGRVFITHRRSGLTAYDAASGRMLWDQKQASACSASLSYDAGVLYYAGGLKGDSSFLTAVDPASGRAVWSVQAKLEYGNDCPKGTAISGGVIVTRVDRLLFGFEAKTGRLLWKASSERNGRKWDLSEPTISDGVVYTSIPSAILGFDLNTGARVFEFATELAENPLDIRMPVVDGVLYFQGNNELPRNISSGRGWIYALDLKSRTILWKYHTGKVSRYDPNGLWSTTHFLPAGGAIYFQTASLVCKIAPPKP